MKYIRNGSKRLVVIALAAMLLSGFISCAKAQETERNGETPFLSPTVSSGVTGGGLSGPAVDTIQPLQQGKALAGLQAVGEDAAYYCNLEGNMMRGGNSADYPVLLCKDPVYDITYYVNYGQDYFIYALRNGKSELAAEVPARELYCKNGELYFLAESYGLYKFEGAGQGNILKYNPVDGSVELIIAEPAVSMRVYEDGIYYETHEMLGENKFKHHRYCFSFAEKKSDELDFNMLLECWRGNRFVTVYPEVFQEMESYQDVYLENREGERVITLGDTLPYGFQVYEEYMYYIIWDSSSLMRRHLETGEIELVAELAVKAGFPACFIIQNDIVYFNNHLRLSLTDGKQYYVPVQGRSIGQESSLDVFFTDGKNLYCVNSGRLWRMSEHRIAEQGLKKGTIPGREAEYHCYEYQLHPVGEE